MFPVQFAKANETSMSKTDLANASGVLHGAFCDNAVIPGGILK